MNTSPWSERNRVNEWPHAICETVPVSEMLGIKRGLSSVGSGDRFWGVSDNRLAGMWQGWKEDVVVRMRI